MIAAEKSLVVVEGILPRINKKKIVKVEIL
jgi:hypothetical protein